MGINYIKESVCSACGKRHQAEIPDLITGKKAIEKLPEELKKRNFKKVFVLADTNTYAAAGKAVTEILSGNRILYSEYIFNASYLDPDEKAVGSALMHYDFSCDAIAAVGSGVVNDIGKILSKSINVPYIIVATAPSMDGYASNTSSMIMDGLKVTLPSKCADVIIGDTDILKNAPLHMLKAGLGDMLAKYISICEWRIGHLITGEYYCEEIADLIRKALKKCVENADGLLKRDEKSVQAIFEGLVTGGIAMAYAGVSRPASGVEHYFSHIWDMRGLEFGTKVDLHGIQCAIGTFICAKIYEQIKNINPNKEAALKYAKNFDFFTWSDELRTFLGKSAEAMIALEEKEQKYNTEKHCMRLNMILENWDSILKIINEEIPSADALDKFYNAIGIPKNPMEAGIENKCIAMTFKATKDIRDKYILSRLAWDLGILDEVAQTL